MCFKPTNHNDNECMKAFRVASGDQCTITIRPSKPPSGRKEDKHLVRCDKNSATRAN